jgi:NOT2 / NOT3 / NOT5 family
MKTERFERGSYLVFDTNTWDAVRKDNFVVRPLRTSTWCS